GLKPGQRKVLFTCFKRNDKREVKVAQLAGSVAEMSSYHHGEAALMMTIINLAQNFVGSNNLNLLQPIGQFGTRLHGGKDSASPRYIFTMLSPLARLVFPPMDDNILRFLYDDNQRVEPEWYMPIIPMVLVNGAEGIGTGWACKIPNFDIREVVNNIRRLMDGEEPLPMLPSYKNFKGTIDELGPNQYVISGEVSILDSTTIEITELPVRTWTQTYKEQVLEPMLNGTEKTPPLITDYKEYHTDTTVRFVVKMAEDKLAEAEAVGLHKVFKLQTSLTCNSMVLFDHVGFLKKYDSPQDILKEFFELRLRYYNLRKEWLIGMLGAESAKLSNQARFILEKIDGKIVIENKPKKELIQVLIQRGYESDPVKAWKEAQNKDEEVGEEEEESDKESAAASGPDFNYLLNMPLWYLTKEKKDELCKQRDNKEKELENLKRKSPSDLWKEDLAAFIEELDVVEAKQAQDESAGIVGKPLKVKGGKAKVKKAQLAEVMPSPHGIRVVPRITPEMRAEAEKKTKKKVKSEKTEFDENQDENTSGEKESGGLKQRLMQKLKTEQGAKRQATLPFKPLKKTKKRNPWSDSGSDSESDFEAPPQRERVVRQAAAKVKPMVISDSDHSSSDEESEFQGDSEGNSESDTNSKKKAPPKPKPAPKETTEKAAKAPKQKAAPSAVPGEFQDVPEDQVSQAPAAPSVPVPSTKAVPKKPPAAKKARATKDNQPSIMDILAKKKAAPKPKPAKEAKEGALNAGGDNAKGRKVRKRQPSSLDSDSDSDFGSKPAKSVASK
ncbi:TOP2A topoisomerase, partial [Horornis vulcanius]|nr:TOP2A topoisomerase [Horornis vulcanius]